LPKLAEKEKGEACYDEEVHSGDVLVFAGIKFNRQRVTSKSSAAPQSAAMLNNEIRPKSSWASNDKRAAYGARRSRSAMLDNEIQPESSAAPKSGSESVTWTSNDRRAAYASSKSRSDSRIWTSNERKAAYGARRSRSAMLDNEIQPESSAAPKSGSESVTWTSNERKAAFGAGRSRSSMLNNEIQPENSAAPKSGSESVTWTSKDRRAAYASSKSRSDSKIWTSDERKAAFGASKSRSLPTLESCQLKQGPNSPISDGEDATPVIKLSQFSFVKRRRSQSRISRIPESSGTSIDGHSFSKRPDSSIQQPKYRRSQSLTS